jgi:hypothetical protein
MRFVASLRIRSLAVSLALASLPAACGDDGGETDSMAGISTTAPASSTGETDGSSTSAATGESTSTTGESTASTAADDTTGGGPMSDPTYPPIVDGSCPQGTLPVTLPGARLCAPFCGGVEDRCPAAVTGNAVPQCMPFAGQGGSGAQCDDVTPCPDGETCSAGACADVAFYACQLMCLAGEACPDAMACSGIGTCGYP